ncbi:MAG TPA: hypothetical protein VLT86_13410 [Vicinamibacterales bacterium]|nr:hypothetical protein [Vicinamibacterales bacterium]
MVIAIGRLAIGDWIEGFGDCIERLLIALVIALAIGRLNLPIWRWSIAFANRSISPIVRCNRRVADLIAQWLNAIANRQCNRQSPMQSPNRQCNHQSLNAIANPSIQSPIAQSNHQSSIGQ